MSQLGNARASTQDNSAGVQFATTTTEDGSAGAIQAVVTVGNKTQYAEVSRTAISAPDAPSGGDLSTAGFAGTSGANLADMGNMLSLAVRATCTVAGAVLSGRVVFYDASNNPLGYSESVTFTSDATLRLSASGDYVSQRTILDGGRARKFRFLTTSVSSGSWSVYLGPI